MTQRISPWDENRWDAWIDGGAPPPPTGDPERLRPPDPPAPQELPDTPQTRKFLKTYEPRAVVPAGGDAHGAEMKGRLDAFRETIGGPYRLPDGSFMHVPAPFQMSTPYPPQKEALAADGIETARTAAGLSEATLRRIQSGRGTPEEIRALTQKLIDQQSRLGATPADGWNEGSIRKLMFDHRIGVDCAGYVQQAYLRATGLTREQAGFRDSLLESLDGLAKRRYGRVAVGDLRPGDLVVLKPPPPGSPDFGEPGHTAIVYDQHAATAGERDEVRRYDGELAGQDPVRVVTVDSSWGSHGEPALGGVRRERWWFDETTREWAYEAHTISDGKEVTTFTRSPSGPYGHVLDGFYRHGGSR